MHRKPWDGFYMFCCLSCDFWVEEDLCPSAFLHKYPVGRFFWIVFLHNPGCICPVFKIWFFFYRFLPVSQICSCLFIFRSVLINRQLKSQLLYIISFQLSIGLEITKIILTVCFKKCGYLLTKRPKCSFWMLYLPMFDFQRSLSLCLSLC